jgi:glucose-6-phosphate 1-dehydrogenase
MQTNLLARRRDLFVIFGGTGDLAHRKLLPALYRLSHSIPPDQRFRVLAVGTDTGMDDVKFRQRAIEEVHRLAELQLPLAWLEQTVFYQGLGRGEPSDYRALAQRIEQLEKQERLTGNRVLYLALPPAIFAPVVRRLGEVGLHRGPGWTRLVVEKPFGSDLASAQELNRLLHQYFEESQIYRIDHYLGKETVQNLLVFRFANSLFEPLWNRDRIESVEITVAESIGVEHRARYYESAGALRDMVQNHLTQLLTLTAMEPPVSFEAEAIRHEKFKVLQAVRPIRKKDVVFGQYTAGEINGRPVLGYRDEPGVAPDSRTETFVALRLEIANWRWHGVPFYLRTGKRLKTRVSRIVVRFRYPPVSIFQPFDCGPIHPNQLIITIQPDEGFDLQFEVKTPGRPFRLETESLRFRYAEAFGGPLPDAYETLLLDILLGDATSFVRDDWVEASWKLYTPILQDPPPIQFYPAGSWGPEAAGVPAAELAEARVGG